MRSLTIVLIGLLLFVGTGLILAQGGCGDEWCPPPPPPPIVDHNQPPGCGVYDVGAPFRPLEPTPVQEPIVCWVRTGTFSNGLGWRYLEQHAGQLLSLDCLHIGINSFDCPVNDLMDPGNWSLVVHPYTAVNGANFHQWWNYIIWKTAAGELLGIHEIFVDPGTACIRGGWSIVYSPWKDDPLYRPFWAR
jgi:hypothetical protein